MSREICRTGRSQFKVLSACRSPLLELRGGWSAFAHTLRWIFSNSLRRVLQKSALIMNEITASVMKVVSRCGNRVPENPVPLHGSEEIGVLVDPLEVFDDIVYLLLGHALVGHAEVEVVGHGFDVGVVVHLFGMQDPLLHPLLTVFVSL